MKARNLVFSARAKVVNEVLDERDNQDRRFGEQNHDPYRWLGILTEEVGEAAQAINDIYEAYDGSGANYNPYRRELIQVAAVALAMVECLDRNTLKE